MNYKAHHFNKIIIIINLSRPNKYTANGAAISVVEFVGIDNWSERNHENITEKQEG